MENYKTIITPFETEIEIKKSRFINQVFHVENENEVEDILGSICKKHYKATHICSAYVLNTLPKRQKANDDGEPSGTAGKPILEVINHRELRDVLVVVIRYFGGIKLGAGGLIRAYGGGASDVLKKCEIIKKQYSKEIDIVITYSGYGSLSNGLAERKIIPVKEGFGENITLSFQISIEDTQAFLEWIENETSGTAQISLGKENYVDIVIK